MTNSSTRSQREKPKKKMKSIFSNRHSDTAFRLLVICLVVIGLIMLLSASYPSAIVRTPPRQITSTGEIEQSFR